MILPVATIEDKTMSGEVNDLLLHAILRHAQLDIDVEILVHGDVALDRLGGWCRTPSVILNSPLGDCIPIGQIWQAKVESSGLHRDRHDELFTLPIMILLALGM